MNAYGIVVVVSLLQLGWCSAEDARDHPVRDIPIESDKFKAIFATVSATEMASNLRQVGPPTRLQLVQNTAGQKYLAQLGEQRTAIDLLEGHKKFADDTWIEISIEDTGNIYEDIAVLGDKKSVHLYREVKEPPRMTIEEFVKRLKNGESFRIRITGQIIPCRVCRGTGKSGGNSSRDACASCSGDGGPYSLVHYRVLW